MNKVTIHIELPDNIANLDDLSFLSTLGSKVRDTAHTAVEKFLTEKYLEGNLDIGTFDKEEIRARVKERVVDALVEKVVENL